MKLSVLAATFCLACSAAYAVGPPPLKINLDEFDALKKVVLLPNSEHLAYIDMGGARECPDPISLPMVLDFHRCDPGPISEYRIYLIYDAGQYQIYSIAATAVCNRVIFRWRGQPARRAWPTACRAAVLAEVVQRGHRRMGFGGVFQQLVRNYSARAAGM